jgi:Ribbon-helix-helix domain
VGSNPISCTKIICSVAFTPPDHWKNPIKRRPLDPNWTLEKAIAPRVPLTTYGCRYTLLLMKRTTIWLQEDHQKKLKALSEKTGAPVSALIRKAIEAYLKKK